MLTPINSGIYILEIQVKNLVGIKHSKLGTLNFSPGFYYYIGSAQRNLKERINRHIAKRKKIFWHIDYLTILHEAIITRVFILSEYQKKEECQLVQNLIQITSAEFSHKNFGNSDCIRCASHLLYSQEKIDYNHLCSLYQSTVLFIPSSKEIF